MCDQIASCILGFTCTCTTCICKIKKCAILQARCKLCYAQNCVLYSLNFFCCPIHIEYTSWLEAYKLSLLLSVSILSSFSFSRLPCLGLFLSLFCLYSLGLGWNSLGTNNKSLSCLADALATNHTLIKLDLSSNQISHEGVTRLASALLNNTTLRELGMFILQSTYLSTCISFLTVFRFLKLSVSVYLLICSHTCTYATCLQDLCLFVCLSVCLLT